MLIQPACCRSRSLLWFQHRRYAAPSCWHCLTGSISASASSPPSQDPPLPRSPSRLQFLGFVEVVRREGPRERHFLQAGSPQGSDTLSTLLEGMRFMLCASPDHLEVLCLPCPLCMLRLLCMLLSFSGGTAGAMLCRGGLMLTTGDICCGCHHAGRCFDTHLPPAVPCCAALQKWYHEGSSRTHPGARRRRCAPLPRHSSCSDLGLVTGNSAPSALRCTARHGTNRRFLLCLFACRPREEIIAENLAAAASSQGASAAGNGRAAAPAAGDLLRLSRGAQRAIGELCRGLPPENRQQTTVGKGVGKLGCAWADHRLQSRPPQMPHPPPAAGACSPSATRRQLHGGVPHGRREALHPDLHRVSHQDGG
jgi:hypothetical protein